MSKYGLRVAIDGRPALWPRTGIGSIAHHVLRNIQALDLSAQYLAYFDRDPGDAIQDYDLTAYGYGGPRQECLWANTWLRKQLERDDVDVFVTFLDKEIPLLPTRARVVCMIHDLIPVRFPKAVFRNTAHKLYYHALIRAAARRADLILTNSTFSKDEIIAHLKVRAEKVQKITLGVEHCGPFLPQQINEVLRRYGLERPYVFAMGSTEPRKNNQRVIEAVRLAAQTFPQLRLAIAGKNWRGVRFDPGLIDSRVSLLGYVPDADLPVLMTGAEMLVFPSLHEGFGFPVIEAMAQGTPVITSNCGALPEVAGDAALYADPVNAGDIAAQIVRVFSNLKLANDLRAKGRERAKLFQWQKTCAEISALCGGLVESQGWHNQPVTP